MKKKIVSILLVVSMMGLMLAGCGSSSSSSSDDSDSSDSTETSSDTDSETDSTAADTIANAPQAETETTKGSDEYDLTQVSERTFTYGHVGADGCSCDIPGDVLNEILQQKTDGLWSVEVYYGGQLGTDSSMVADVQSGSLDFYSANIANFQADIPEVAAFDMPFFYDNWDELDEYLNYNDELYDELYDMFYEAGFVLLPWQVAGWRQISSNVELTSVDDFDGLNIRIPVLDSYITVFESLGSSPTAINSSELYLALQQNMVSAQENPYDQIYTYGFGEVQDYITNSNHLVFFNQVVFSTQTWEGLNEVEQEILMDAAEEMAEYVKDWNKEVQDYYLEALQTDYDMTFIDFDEIDGLRDELRETSFDYCYEEIYAMIEEDGGDPTFLDEYIEMRGFSDMLE